MLEVSIRMSRRLGRIWVERTALLISTGGSLGWAKSSGTWKLPTWGSWLAVIPPSFGRDKPL
jgi:uncharacterized membrane protein (DUF2068 family)